MKLGIIAGRHQMPVDRYLVDNVEPGQAAYDAVWLAADHLAKSVPKGTDIDLYYGGLTEATIAAIDALEGSERVRLRLFRYDAPSASYVEILRGMPTERARR